MNNMTVKAKKNPIIAKLGICDPHVRIFDGKLFLFTGHDESVLQDDYSIIDWQIFSSNDGVTFEHRHTIVPETTYMGSSNLCWACDAIERNGKYYFYFSNGNKDIGVMVANSPQGPYVDVLNKPLVEHNSTLTMEYDPHVFIDDDNTPYIIFGGPSWAYGQAADGYYMARLKDNMIELDEIPTKVEVDHRADDKVALHKFNDLYYMSWASHYAVSKDIRGPYHYLSNTGVSKDHGVFFEWNNQWFNAFTIFDPSMVYRSIGLCYVKYTKERKMVSDTLTVEYGIGQYDANWHTIDATNYMKASRYLIQEGPNGGFEVEGLAANDYLVYPNIHNMPKNATIHFFCRALQAASCTIEIREGNVTGAVLGTCVPVYHARELTYDITSLKLSNNEGTNSLCIVIKGSGGALLHLDSFSIS